ncbi:MAG TPA: cation transporter [Candidatus Aminicenantes bacterium]|nr:cation transporter [Candidatus Aminicenantes bacterium]
MKRVFAAHTVLQFIFLMSFWLLLSGHYDLFHISMGVVSALLVTTLNLKLRRFHFYREEIRQVEARIKRQMPVSLRPLRFLYYIAWLFWQIVVASLQVAYAVLSPRMPIDPSMVVFKTRLPNASARVILGNSITLTPGTITVQLRDDEFVVHALMDVSASGILDGSLPGQVARLYEKTPGQVVGSIAIIRSKGDM